MRKPGAELLIAPIREAAADESVDATYAYVQAQGKGTRTRRRRAAYVRQQTRAKRALQLIGEARA